MPLGANARNAPPPPKRNFMSSYLKQLLGRVCFEKLPCPGLLGIMFTRGEARISDGGGPGASEASFIWESGGQAPSENFEITVYNDRLYSMRDPLQ